MNHVHARQEWGWDSGGVGVDSKSIRCVLSAYNILIVYFKKKKTKIKNSKTKSNAWERNKIIIRKLEKNVCLKEDGKKSLWIEKGKMV